MSDINWSDVLGIAKALGRNAFVGSVGPGAQPHLAIVWVVEANGELHFVSDRVAAKIRNLTANPAVAVHWQVSEEGPNEGLQLFVRGRAEMVERPDARQALWDSGAWGDLGQWYSGPLDPKLSFVRIAANSASLMPSRT